MKINQQIDRPDVADSNVSLSELKPWKKFFKVDVDSLAVPSETIYQSIKTGSQTVLDKPALHYYGAEISYRELLDRIDQYADAYVSAGVKAGDVVSFISVALPETVISLYALNKIGAISSFIDPRMDKERIKHFVEKVDSDILVTLEQVLPKVEPWLPEAKLKKVLVQSPADGLNTFSRLAYRLKHSAATLPSDSRVEWFRDFVTTGERGIAREHPYEKDAACAYTQTGGTTGVPKCVVLTNEGLNAVAMGFKYYGIDAHEGDSFLDIMPIFSSYGIVCGVHMTLTMKFKVFLIPDFSPDKFPRLIRKFKPNHLLAVPAFYEKLTHDPGIQKMDLSFVLSMGSGGDTITPELEKKLNTFFHEHGVRYPIAQGYGMSEVSSAATFGQGLINKPLSVGIPTPLVTIGIFKQDSYEEMPAGEEGEICIAGPSVMKEYLDDPEATDDLIRIHPDGKRWAHSGDLGYMDEEGFLFVSGRIKQMIIRFDGHKLAPTQIENVILKRPEVNHCVVIPVQDMDHGQGDLPMAVVELKPGLDDKAICQNILDYCNEIMEERGRPCAVVAMKNIPLTSVGKSNRKSVEKIYKNYNYRESI